MTRQEKAARLHDRGLNCAQCVAGACADITGADEETLIAATGGFGGGLRCGEVCGAVSGAVLTLGLAFPYTGGQDPGAKNRIAALTREFIRRFREKHGAVVCRELLAASRVRRCPEYIASAVEIAETLIDEDNKRR